MHFSWRSSTSTSVSTLGRRGLCAIFKSSSSSALSALVCHFCSSQILWFERRHTGSKLNSARPTPPTSWHFWRFWTTTNTCGMMLVQRLSWPARTTPRRWTRLTRLIACSSTPLSSWQRRTRRSARSSAFKIRSSSLKRLGTRGGRPRQAQRLPKTSGSPNPSGRRSPKPHNKLRVPSDATTSIPPWGARSGTSAGSSMSACSVARSTPWWGTTEMILLLRLRRRL